MDYIYEIPVIVKLFGDESENNLPLTKRILEFVRDKLSHDTKNLFGCLEGDVSDLYLRSKLEKFGGGIIISITLLDDQRREQYNEDILAALNTWTCYGEFEGGLPVQGRYYGYSHEEVVVYTWDSKLNIVAKNNESRNPIVE